MLAAVWHGEPANKLGDNRAMEAYSNINLINKFFNSISHRSKNKFVLILYTIPFSLFPSISKVRITHFFKSSVLSESFKSSRMLL